MGTIRTFSKEDIPGTARLHRQVFGGRESDAQDTSLREAYLRRLFLERTDGYPSVPSLVYEDHGKVVGFLGVVPREMMFMGKPVVAAVSSQFIVDPDCRAGMVGIQLLKEYFKGPQDLSIADEANNVARTLWGGFGGVTAALYSLYWTHPLRPIQYALSLMRGRRTWAPFAAAARPLARVLDTLAAHIPGSPVCRPRTDLFARTVSDESLWSYLPEFYADHTLRPEYHLAEWKDILQRAQNKHDCGAFQRIAVKNDRHDTLGWYLYYLNPGGTSEVLQMAARPKCGHMVLTHLLHHAWRGGAAAVSGRLQPGWMQVHSENRENRCFFHRGPWVLVHSKWPNLVQAFYEGTACFSRLEGEWCLRYR